LHRPRPGAPIHARNEKRRELRAVMRSGLLVVVYTERGVQPVRVDDTAFATLGPGKRIRLSFDGIEAEDCGAPDRPYVTAAAIVDKH
jgi:hypothetical protein